MRLIRKDLLNYWIKRKKNQFYEKAFLIKNND